jgi:hypothetical protein
LIFTIYPSESLTTLGSYPVSAWCKSPDDLIATNDSIFSLGVNVSGYPIIAPLEDTLLCGHHTVTLDAGAGASSYLWSTGDTTQIITVDTIKIGYGQTWVTVIAANNGCSTTDSVSITFVDCTSAPDILKNTFSAYISPNPLIDESIIHLNGKDVVIEVFDIYGRLVLSAKTYQYEYSLKKSLLKSGTYFVRLKSESNLFTIKLLVN